MDFCVKKNENKNATINLTSDLDSMDQNTLKTIFRTFYLEILTPAITWKSPIHHNST